MPKKVQIFILTKDRLPLLKRSLNSVLAQTYNEIQVIISDNSTGDQTENELGNRHDREFKYIRRQPSLPVIDHHNIILSEITSPYFMMFHDDDVMHPEMVRTLLQELEANKELIAIASNAWIYNNGKRSGLFFRTDKQDITISNREEMAEKYLCDKDFAPFPSYLYRKIVAEKQRMFFSRGREYSDASFIIDLIYLGKVYFKSNPLMDYNIIANQGNLTFNNFCGRIELSQYISSTTRFHIRHPYVRMYRLSNLYYELRIRFMLNSETIFSKRDLRVGLLLLRYSPVRLFPSLISSIVRYLVTRYLSGKRSDKFDKKKY